MSNDKYQISNVYIKDHISKIKDQRPTIKYQIYKILKSNTTQTKQKMSKSKHKKADSTCLACTCSKYLVENPREPIARTEQSNTSYNYSAKYPVYQIPSILSIKSTAPSIKHAKRITYNTK